jgi:large-conductance mechanosensitive channel
MTHKHVIAVIVLSVVVALTQPWIDSVLQAYLGLHDWINGLLTYVIAGGKVGTYISNVLSFLILPFAIGLLIAGVHWLLKKSFVPWFMTAVWVAWLILTTGLILR